MYNLINKHRSI